jgi:hypothetical protein
MGKRGGRYQVAGDRYQVSGDRRLGVRYQVPGIRYQVSGDRRQVKNFRTFNLFYFFPLQLFNSSTLQLELCKEIK